MTPEELKKDTVNYYINNYPKIFEAINKNLKRKIYFGGVISFEAPLVEKSFYEPIKKYLEYKGWKNIKFSTQIVDVSMDYHMNKLIRNAQVLIITMED